MSTCDTWATRRTTVAAVEKLIGEKIPVGDDGFVKLVDYLGTDRSITAAARVSYTGGKTLRDDRGLIRYLLRHQHTSPFEFCEIVLHIRAPLFVARQWYRHRTANVNEISGRYTTLPEGHFVPTELNLRPTKNKQGRADEFLKDDTELLQSMQDAMNRSRDVYNQLVAAGVAYEVARVALPMGNYTEWYWKMDLHNLLRFLRLRMHHSAQIEIQKYATAVASIVRQWVPITYEAFTDYQTDAVSLSRAGLECLKMRLRGIEVTEENSGMSKGEWAEFQEGVLDKL